MYVCYTSTMTTRLHMWKSETLINCFNFAFSHHSYQFISFFILFFYLVEYLLLRFLSWVLILLRTLLTGILPCHHLFVVFFLWYSLCHDVLQFSVEVTCMFQSNHSIVGRVRVLRVLRSNLRERQEMPGLHLDALVCPIHASTPKVMSVGVFLLSLPIFVVPLCSLFSICFPETLQLQLLCWENRQEAKPPFRNRRARGTHAFSGYSLSSSHFGFSIAMHVAQPLSFKILHWIPNLGSWTAELKPGRNHRVVFFGRALHSYSKYLTPL